MGNEMISKFSDVFQLFNLAFFLVVFIGGA